MPALYTPPGTANCLNQAISLIDLNQGQSARGRRSLNECNGDLTQTETIPYRGSGPDNFRLADDPLGAVAKHCAVTRERS